MRAKIDRRLDDLTEKVIGAAFAVSNSLGHGFLEKVYKNALVEELSTIGLAIDVEKTYSIRYRGKIIGSYAADLVVENTVIVELKAVENLSPAHAAQLLNYLKVSGVPIGLLMNFGKPRLEMKRLLLGQSVQIR